MKPIYILLILVLVLSSCQINPQDGTAYLNRGNAHAKQGDYEKAIADYDRAIQIDPQDAMALDSVVAADQIFE